MGADTGQPFGRVGLVGLGLIGGSIAHALRRRAPSVEITGVDRAEVTAAASAAGLIDHVATGVTGLGDVDLIVLATPIPAIVEAVATLGRVGPRAVVTDVGSTKRHIVEAARTAGLEAFVGGHPMAGRERGGLTHASAELFEGRRWILVPGTPGILAPGTSARSAVDRVAAWVRLLGAVPQEMEPAAHDRTMAYVSHLPQMLSTSLMTQVGEAVGPGGLACAGRGLEDLTRLSGSPADIWTGILATNADFVRAAAAGLIADLTSFAAELDDAGALESRFARANHLREGWSNRKGGRN